MYTRVSRHVSKYHQWVTVSLLLCHFLLICIYLGLTVRQEKDYNRCSQSKEITGVIISEENCKLCVTFQQTVYHM